MIKDLLRTARTILLPQLLIGGFVMLAAAAFSAVQTRVRTEDAEENIYILGKRSDPKAVCVTNQTPVSFAKSVILRQTGR